MKQGINISTTDFLGRRINPSLVIGKEFNGYTSGEIFDANATVQLVDKRVADIVGLAPETLDSLEEIADVINSKQDTINDLDAIRSGAAAGATALQEHQDISGKQDIIDDLLEIRSGATAGATAYQKPSGGIPKSDLAEGVQTSLDKADSALQSHQSLSGYATETWVQGRGYLTQHQDISGKANISDLATVATTGNYSDLNGKPAIPQIPTNVSAFVNDANYVTKTQFDEAVGDIKDDWYGIMWTSKNYVPHRIGNMNMHRNLPIQSGMKRCTLKDDGSVYGYISQTDKNLYDDGRQVDYAGSHGQVMVEVPEYHFDALAYTENDITTYVLKLYPYSNKGKLSKKVYAGAYEATSNDADSDESTKKLYSITTVTTSTNNTSINVSDLDTIHADAALYRGGNQRTSGAWDSEEKSQLGRPVTGLTRAAFRDRASNRGTGWSQQYWSAYMSIVRLYVVEYCNFNSQDTYYNTTDSNGYHRGGLGPGLTAVNGEMWNTFDSYNPIVPCGLTNVLRNDTGIVTFSNSTFSSLQIPSYRGIENPFGHIWKWTDGVNILGNTPEGHSSIYTCDDITKFADNTSENYVLRTANASFGTNGYIKNWSWDENGDFIPNSQGGSSSSYLYDYSWFENVGWKVLSSSGSAHIGARCGWFYFDAKLGSSYSSAHVGGRLYYTSAE